MTPDGPMLVQLRQHFFLRQDGLPFLHPSLMPRFPRPLPEQDMQRIPRHWKVVLVLRPKKGGRALLREGEVKKELVRHFGKERVATVESLSIREGERQEDSNWDCSDSYCTVLCRKAFLPAVFSGPLLLSHLYLLTVLARSTAPPEASQAPGGSALSYPEQSCSLGKHQICYLAGPSRPLFVIAAHRLLRQARLLVAVHGAALTNMIFMASKTFILELRPHKYNLALYETMAKEIDLNYYLSLAHGNKGSFTRPNMSSIHEQLVAIKASMEDQEQKNANLFFPH